MLEKSLIVWVALNSAIIIPENTLPTQEEIIQRIWTHFNEKITNIIIRDVYDVANDSLSIENFVWISCRVDQVLNSRIKWSEIKTTAYSCEDEYQGDYNYNIWRVFWTDIEISDSEICRDLKIFFSSEKWKYDLWQAAYINKLNEKWEYELDYYYPNTSCDEVINDWVPYNK